jgi:hypothetical protein
MEHSRQVRLGFAGCLVSIIIPIQISLVAKRTFDFPGQILQNAMAAGNVDNNLFGDHALVVGNIDGAMGIFKLSSNNPRWFATDLGTITNITIGDIRGNTLVSFFQISKCV